MALTLKLDAGQLQTLVTAINDLSASIDKGFSDLIATLGEEDSQEHVDQLTNAVKTVKDKLQTSINSQTKGD